MSRIPKIAYGFVCALVLAQLILLNWKHQGVWLDSESLWRHAIKHNPQARDAHLNLSAALFDQERYEEALDAARIAVQLRPSHYKSHWNMGMTLNRLKRYAEAESSFHRAFDKTVKMRDAPHVLQGLAFSLIQQEKWEEALDITQQVLVLDPELPVVWANLGGIYGSLGRYQEAVEAFDRALALDPTDEDARQNRAAVLEALRQQQEE